MLSIDRFEGDYAVCIDDEGVVTDIEKSLIEGEPEAGDFIYLKEGRYYVAEDKTQAEREEISALQDELFQ